MASLLFYKKPVPLNKADHQNVKLKSTNRSYAFASGTNSVIVAGIEFSEAAKEYPIVFAEAGEGVIPVALLGLRNNENLYVNDDESWDAKYIPAFVRRYPFVLAATGDSGSRAVCIDEEFDGFSEDEGEALFDGEETTPLLQQAMDFLEEYQRQYLRTEAFVNRLRENDLLMTLNAQIDMVDGQKFGLTGLQVVDERRLLQLSDEKALEFFRAGELSWIYCHLSSLGCMARLVDRMGLKTDDAPAEAAADENADAPPKTKAAAQKKAAAKAKVKK